MKVVLLISFLLLININFVLGSVAITPPKTNLYFEPNLNKALSFGVINRIDQSLNIDVLVEGDISNYVTIKTPNITIGPRESKGVEFELSLPNDLKPGTHIEYIIVRELPNKPLTGTISTYQETAFTLNVIVPYPGDYLEIELDSDEGVQQGNDVSVTLLYNNLGINDLLGIKTNVEFFELNGSKKIGFLNFKDFDLKSLEQSRIMEYQSTKDWNLGFYQAIAKVNYAGKSINATKNFKVGDIKVEIVGLNKTRYESGKINRIEVIAASKWNQLIGNIYVTVSLVDNNGRKLEARSATTEIGPWDKVPIPVFLDMTGLKEGTYDLTVDLSYMDKSDTKVFKIEIFKSLFSSIFRLETILIIVIVILAILLVFNYVKSRRNKKRDKKQK